MRNEQSNYYHERAEEVRAVGLRMNDPGERHRIVQIADDYEKMASEAPRGVANETLGTDGFRGVFG